MDRKHEVIRPEESKPLLRSRSTQTIPRRRRRRRRQLGTEPQPPCFSPEHEKSLSRRQRATPRAADAYLDVSPTAFALPLQRYIERMLNGRHHVGSPPRAESVIFARNSQRTTNVREYEDEKQGANSRRVTTVTARRTARTRRRALFPTTPPKIGHVLSCCAVTSANRATTFHEDTNDSALLSMCVPLGILKPVGPSWRNVQRGIDEDIRSRNTDSPQERRCDHLSSGMAAGEYGDDGVVENERITIKGGKLWERSPSTHIKHSAKCGECENTSWGNGGAAHSGDVLDYSDDDLNESTRIIADISRERQRREHVHTGGQDRSSMSEDGRENRSGFVCRRMRPRPFSAQIRVDTGVRHRSSCTWDLLTGRRISSPHTERFSRGNGHGKNLQNVTKVDRQLLEMSSPVPSSLNNGEPRRTNPVVTTRPISKREKMGHEASDDGGSSPSSLISTAKCQRSSTQIHDKARFGEEPGRAEPDRDTSATVRSASLGQRKASGSVSTETIDFIGHERIDYLAQRRKDSGSQDGRNPLKISQETQYMLQIDHIIVHGVQFAAAGSTADPFVVIRAGGRKTESQRVEDVEGGVCERCNWPAEVLTLKGITEENLRTTGLEVEVWDDLGWIIARGNVPADAPQLHSIKGIPLSAKTLTSIRQPSSTEILCSLRDRRGSFNGDVGHATFNIQLVKYAEASQTAPVDNSKTGGAIVEMVGKNNEITTDVAPRTSSTPTGMRVTKGVDLNEFDMPSLNPASYDESESGMDILLFSPRVGSAPFSSSPLSSPSSSVQASSLGTVVLSSCGKVPMGSQTVRGSEWLRDHGNGRSAPDSGLKEKGDTGRVETDEKIPVQASASASVTSTGDKAIGVARTISVVSGDGHSDGYSDRFSDEYRETNGASIVSNDQTPSAASFLSFSDRASEDDIFGTRNGNKVSEGSDGDAEANWALEEAKVSEMAADLRRRLRRAAEKCGAGDLTTGVRLVFETLNTSQGAYLSAEHLLKALPSTGVGRRPSPPQLAALVAGIDSTGKLSVNFRELEAFIMQDVGVHDSDGQSRYDAKMPEEGTSELAALWLRLRRAVDHRGRVPSYSARQEPNHPISHGSSSPTLVPSPKTILTADAAQGVGTQDGCRRSGGENDRMGNEQEPPIDSGGSSGRGPGLHQGKHSPIVVIEEGKQVESSAGKLPIDNRLGLDSTVSAIYRQVGEKATKTGADEAYSGGNVGRCCFESLDEGLFAKHDPGELGVVSSELFHQIISGLNLGTAPPLAAVDLFALSRRFGVTNTSGGERVGRNLGAPLPDMVLYQKFSAWIHPMDIDRVVKRISRFLRAIGDPSSRSKFGLEPNTEGDAREVLQNVFRLIDRDSSGRISDDELLTKVNGLGLPVTAAEARLLVLEYGGGDVEGGLSFIDFERMISRQIAVLPY